MIFHWPQIVWACLAVFHVMVCAMRDGEQKTGTHKFSVDFVSFLLGVALLYFGGFFAGATP